MKQILAWVLVLVTFIGVSGCKRTHESVIKDEISNMKKLASILKDVKDEASAKAAAPKIESIAKEMKSLGEEAKKMGDPPKDVEETLKKKYKDDRENIRADLSKELTRIMLDPKLSETVTKAMGDFGR
jgi:hypothetical protein